MIKLTAAQAKAFTSDACDEITQSHDDALNDINGTPIMARPKWEAQSVARLCSAANGIASKWRSRIRAINPSLTLSLASVFTHQTPYVEWPPRVKPSSPKPPNRCELADLLIAVIDRSAGFGHAVLIQAKQSDTGSTTLTTPSERRQFDLLSGRPLFDMDAAVAPTGVDLRALTPDDSLQYGLNPPDTVAGLSSATVKHRWTMADQLGGAVTYHVSTSDCLAEWMVEQLQGKRGWQFQLPPAGKTWQHFSAGIGKDSWSELINYLLEVTLPKKLTQFAFGGNDHRRGQEEAMGLAIHGHISGKGSFLTDSEGAGHIVQLSVNRDDRTLIPDERSSLPAANLLDLILRDGRSGDGGAGDGNDGNPDDPEGPENGPISAIVFEIGRLPEG